MAYTQLQIGVKRAGGLIAYGESHPDCSCVPKPGAQFPRYQFFVADLDEDCLVHKDAPDKTGGG